MDIYERLAWSHSILEQSGSPRQKRSCVCEYGGGFALIVSEMKGDTVVIVDTQPLPERLNGPLRRLETTRESWLELLATRRPVRHGHIVAAIEELDRFSASMRTRAMLCTGPYWLIHRVISIMLNATRMIAAYGGDRVAVFADGVFEEAALEITALLDNARCGQFAA